MARPHKNEDEHKQGEKKAADDLLTRGFH